MISAKSYAAFDAKSPLRPYALERREPGERDVVIDILYCGVCHSDLHQVRNEWGNSTFPMVPGHEIVGKVARVGAKVEKHKVGDTVGVGCMVDSCRTCGACGDGLEQYCEVGAAMTYNGLEMDRKTPTQGGYSTRVVVNEDFTLAVRATDDLDGIAPLLCAGITTYSPLKHWKIGKGHKVAVLGLGGLGHMAVKLAAALGAEVTLLSGSPKKKADAERLGAHEFVATSDEAAVRARHGRFDLLLDTVSAKHDIAGYTNLVRRDGTMVLLGVPSVPAEVPAFALIMNRRSLAGSLIGGIAETQEMLDFCVERGIRSDVETIPIQQIDGAYERMLKGDVRYRFVIDTKSLG
jgi:alcohol dehydrogenase (NADP+)